MTGLLIIMAIVILIQLVFMGLMVGIYLNMSKTFRTFKDTDLRVAAINDGVIDTLDKTIQALAGYMGETNRYLEEAEAFLDKIQPEMRNIKNECDLILRVASGKAAHVTSTAETIRLMQKQLPRADQKIYDKQFQEVEKATISPEEVRGDV